MNKKVLVTGGAGFIGSHTVVELINAGYEPIIIDDFSNSRKSVVENLIKLAGQEIKLYEGKVQDKGLLQLLFKQEGNIHACIHFAAHKAVGESVEKPLMYYDNNINSLMVLIEVMQMNSCNNLVFSSSCTVYGEPEQLPVTEETPRKEAQSPYGNTKKICEDIIKDTVSKNISQKAVSLRYFNPIGAHPSGLIGELPIGVPANLVPFITQTAAGIREKLTVFGNDYDTPDGSCVRDYIHVVDLANAHVAAIRYLDRLQGEQSYEVFNVGVGRGYTVLELIKEFEKTNAIQLPVQMGSRRSGDVEKIFADTTKVNEIMSWKAKLDIKQALKDAWNWQLELQKNE